MLTQNRTTKVRSFFIKVVFLVVLFFRETRNYSEGLRTPERESEVSEKISVLYQERYRLVRCDGYKADHSQQTYQLYKKIQHR